MSLSTLHSRIPGIDRLTADATVGGSLNRLAARSDLGRRESALKPMAFDLKLFLFFAYELLDRNSRSPRKPKGMAEQTHAA